jgi:hypothetical protein
VSFTCELSQLIGRRANHKTQNPPPRHVRTPFPKEPTPASESLLSTENVTLTILTIKHTPQSNTMEPSAVIPNYDQTFPLKDSVRAIRRPSILTVSSVASSRGRSPEPSPTRERFRQGSETADEIVEGIVEGPFMYVGHKKRRFHAQRDSAPYPLPCGLEELSRYDLLQCQKRPKLMIE